MHWVWLIVLTIALILIVIALVVRRAMTPIAAMKARFDAVKDSPADGSGLLISVISIDQAKDMIRREQIRYKDFDQCAPVNRKTCAAWTFIRRDIWNSAYIIPGQGLSIGFIIDPAKAWSLITTMSVIDGDTARRSACSNETGYDFQTAPTDQQTCADILLGAARPDASGARAYVPKNSAGSALVPTKCGTNNQTCRYLNSGGGINLWDMLYWKRGANCAFQNCYNFTPDASGNFAQTPGDCAACTKPYLCAPVTPPNSAAARAPLEEQGQITGYVGARGENWVPLYWSDAIGYMNIHQCKFERKAWKAWIGALHNFYSKLLSISSSNVSMNPLLNLNDLRKIPYLENEVNMYIYPDSEALEYKEQERAFFASIMGVFYISSTCEEQLVPLSAALDVSGACQALRKCGDSGACTESNRQEIIAARDVAEQLAKLLTRQLGRDIPMLGAKLDSNMFPHEDNLRRALTGTNLFSDYFDEL